MHAHDHAPGIVTVSGVLSPLECEVHMSTTETHGYSDAPVTTAWGPRMIPGIRNNTRVMIDDHERARWLWERIEPFVPPTLDGRRVVGLNERFRYYRYHPGQYFNWHRDGAFRRSRQEASQLTLMVYLNDDFTGGRTEFSDAAPIDPQQGMVLLFEHTLGHRGAPVESGTKYVMRTDVMYRVPTPNRRPAPRA